MNGFSRLVLLLILAFSIVSCTSRQTNSEEADQLDAGAEATESAEENFSDDLDATPESEEAQAAAEAAPVEEAPAESPPNEQAVAEEAPLEDSLDQEIADSEGVSVPPEPEAQVDEFADFEDQAPPATPVPAPEIVAEPPPPIIAEQPTQPEPPPPALEATPETPTQELATIKDIKYKANDHGGTVVVESSSSITFTTRMNAETNQMIIEIPNAKLPTKLKRTLNTKDIKGTIGAIDAYQAKDSTTTRVVVQLREGASEPVVQSEGNSLLIVADPVSGGETQVAEGTSESSQEVTENQAANENKILSSQNIEEFLAGNTQFYGKKISLEVNDMGIKELIKLISEESGANLVLAEEVRGTVSLKLREVPWDQALVIIMKTKKLGYTRSGNVIRIAQISDIKKEEDDALKIASERKSHAPIKVRMISVSYAKVEDISKQIDTLLKTQAIAGSTPPQVIADPRTSSIVISAPEEMIERAMKLVKSIDVPPPQVLIEGKVVEATQGFLRNIGVNWSASGATGRTEVASSKGTIKTNTSFAVSPGSIGTRSFALDMSVGTLDILGDLTATLGLYEQTDQVKVISSPRIVTLHNEKAEIKQTTQIPIPSSTINGNSITNNITFKDIKLSLGVEPQITNDGSVIMKVELMREFLGANVESVSGQRSINSRSANSKVLVKNGQTAVIGGIYQSDVTEGEKKVPWVGDLPIVGWLFKTRSVDRQKNELLIFLTPRILGQADSQAAVSPGEM